MLVYKQRKTYVVPKKGAGTKSIHQLSSCEQSITGRKNSGENTETGQRICSGKAAKDEPECFHIIDPIFSETHIELKVVTKGADILESDKSSVDDECIEEDESDGILVQSTMSVCTY